MNTKKPRDLATLFFGAYRRQVLGLLLLHPDESFHLREIARITGTQPGTLRRELALLTEAGVLQCKKVGNQSHYKANLSCPIYEELRGILRKTSGVADVLREALKPLAEKISVAFVYGSVAHGTERQTSDIDVMILGSVDFDQVVQALYPAQEWLRREINPSVYNPTEFARKARAKGSFLSRVLDGPMLFLVGKQDDLRKLAKDRKVKTA